MKCTSKKNKIYLLFYFIIVFLFFLLFYLVLLFQNKAKFSFLNILKAKQFSSNFFTLLRQVIEKEDQKEILHAELQNKQVALIFTFIYS